MNDTICYLSATDARAMFQRGELTPLEVLDAQLARAQAYDGELEALTEVFADEAREHAAKAAERYRDGTARPLEGITVAAKEKHMIAGHRVSEGSAAWPGFTATENAPIIDRLLDAGAIIHARTATPEFSIAGFTHSKLWGVTRNPWNTQFSPGGSSGGAGAALAAGFTTLATASDIGGSTRGPSSFTGNVGFKAPYGRVPGIGPMSLDYYRGDGPMGRTVADVALFTNVIAGQDPRDHVSLPAPNPLPETFADIAGMRIALSFDLGGFRVDPQVRDNTRAVAEALTRAGAEVVEVTFGLDEATLLAAAGTHFAQMMARMVEHTVGDGVAELTDYAGQFVAEMAPVGAATRMFDAARAEYVVQQAIAQAMSGFDVLLCPTAATTGLIAGDSLLTGAEIDGEEVSSAETMLTIPFNVANRCPVLAVPSGHARNGVPTGVQLVGHPYADESVFRVGAALEQLRPWAYTAEHRPAL